MEFFTIGVYNSTESQFFKKLTDNEIDTFCDIRQRRGVRGAKYSFVNSKKLQNKLNALNIKYGHIVKLAPTNEIRNLQKTADLLNDESKKQRQLLSDVFIDEYIRNVVDNFDFEYFFEELENIGAKRIVLFCVEENYKACHRSIISQELENRFKYAIKHL